MFHPNPDHLVKIRGLVAEIADDARHYCKAVEDFDAGRIGPSTIPVAWLGALIRNLYELREELSNPNY